MKRLAFISLSVNVLLLTLGFLVLQRLGGWNYTLYRLQHAEPALYTHRRQLFEQLPVQPGALIFLGDSQTEQAEWRELFGDNTLILNRGITGDHTQGLLNRLDEIVRHKPLKIFLLVGINDLISGDEIPLIAARYRAVVQRITHDSPATQLILESILPVNPALKNIAVTNQNIQLLNAQIAEIARAHDLPFADLYGALIDQAGNLSEQFTADGLHLNGAGYAVWKQQLQPFLEK